MSPVIRLVNMRSATAAMSAMCPDADSMGHSRYKHHPQGGHHPPGMARIALVDRHDGDPIGGGFWWKPAVDDFRKLPTKIVGRTGSERKESKPMSNSTHPDPAERSALMRLFYRDWRPTRLGRWVNGFACWWSGLGLPPKFQAALEVRGRTSGRRHSNPVDRHRGGQTLPRIDVAQACGAVPACPAAFA